MKSPMWAFLAVLGCGGPPAADPPTSGLTDAERAQALSMRLRPMLRSDPTNRWADDPRAAELGQALFFDPALSPSGTVSCSTCHQPGKAFTDGLALSRGAGQTGRNAPAIPGSQAGPWLYLDGRVDSVWAQAAGPIEHPDEMASDRMFVARVVTTRHRTRYEAAFGPAPDLSDPARFPTSASPAVSGPASTAWSNMTDGDRAAVQEVFVRSLKAIAAYERLLVPQESAFDRHLDSLAAGGPSPFGTVQEQGLRLFLRSGCTDCHHGPWMSDRAFHNLGLPFQGPFDGGRSIGAAQVLESEFNCRSPWSDADSCPELDFLDPTFPDFQQAFKTPSLRNVALTGPYMHHGQLPDLRAVVDFYAELPGDAAVNHRELTLRPRPLTPADRDALVAFLTTLTGDPWPEALVQPIEPR